MVRFHRQRGPSGNIEDDSWSVRSFVDRRVLSTGNLALTFGLGYEYGEARSWVKNAVFSDEGPHTFTSGGAFRAGIHQAWGSRVELHAALEQAIYHAHATDASVGNVYNWLGRAFSATVGVRFIVIRGREEPELMRVRVNGRWRYRTRSCTSAARRSLASTRVPFFRRRTSTCGSS